MRMNDRIVYTLFVSVFATTLGLGIISPLLPGYATSMGASGLWIGIIFSSFALARAVFMPIVGKKSDLHGRKGFIWVGLLFYSVLSLGYVISTTVLELAWVRFLHGVASAMVLPVAMAYVGDLAPKGEEGKYLGRFHSSLFIGMGTGPFIGGVINDSLGYAWAFYTLGALSFLALLLVLILLPGEEKRKREVKEIRFKRILKNNLVQGLIAYRMVTSIGRSSIMTFLPLLAAIELGLTPTEIGLILSLGVVVMGALQAPFGALADRYSRVGLVVLGSLIAAFALAIMPFSANFAQLLFLNLVIGIGGAISIPAATAITAEIGRSEGMGSVMGIFDTAMSAGMFSGPLLGGLVFDLVDIYSVFYLCAFLGLIGTAFFYVLSR